MLTNFGATKTLMLAPQDVFQSPNDYVRDENVTEDGYLVIGKRGDVLF